MKINRILENRSFSPKGDPYKLFERRFIDAFFLEREIKNMKIGKREKYQSRIQFVVFLVSCLESFLEEIFRRSFEKGFFKLKDLKNEKEIKGIKANLDEISEINKHKIKLSEILAEEMNFQNINDIISLCELLKVSKNYKKISLRRREIEFSKLDVLKNPSKKMSKENEKKLTKFVMDEVGRGSALPKNDKAFIRIVYVLKKMILLRNKIVHKNMIIKMKSWETLVYAVVSLQIAYLISESYKIELKKVKK